MDRLKGKVAIVTGGASGIGEASVRLFLAQGARVIIADMQDDLGRALAAELGERCLFQHTDVSRSDHVKDLCAVAIDRFGRLDVMFNNAGIITIGPKTAETPDEVFDRMISVDLKGVWLGIKYAVPAMLKSGGGSIINTASGSGLLGYTGQSGYGAAKGGVVQLTRHVASEYAAQGIRVNCVCPTGTLTPLVYARRPGVAPADVDRLFAERSPDGRPGRAEDTAHAALFFASDDSVHVNGQVLAIDGGMSAMVFRGRREGDA